MPRTLTAFTVLLLASLSALRAADRVQFNRDIRPILSDTCFNCHGHDEKQRKAGLRLDLREEALKPAKSGEVAIVPGKPGSSALIARVLTDDEDDIMPPAKLHKPLSKIQKDTLRRWIAEGAEYQGHWAFQTPTLPTPPANTDAKNGAIDAFVGARLKTEKLDFSPEASREVLLRRATLALTGLPPTPNEAEAFLQSALRDPQSAIESLVDRLLASPHFGERMATPWLDLARHSDTAGYHNDSLRQTWLWRDWVVKSFNDNKPFDRFTIEQLAGDLLPGATVDQKIASGFMRNVMTSDEEGIIEAEYLNIYLVDRVSTLGTTWLGMSVGCAQCHDHKYDPVTMRDFYGLYAFFNAVPERGKDGTRTLNPEPRMSVPSPGQTAEIGKLDAKIAAADRLVKEHEAKLDAEQAEWEAKQSGESQAAGIAAPFDHFPLNADGSGRTHDGQAIEGALSGRTDFVDGANGKALELKGAGHIDLGARYAFEMSDKFSVAAWLRLPKGGKGGAPIGKIENGPNFRGWDIEFHGAKANVHLIHKWPEETIHVQAQPDLPADSFQHFAFTYDGSGKAAGVKFFVNGKSVPTTTVKDNLTGTIKTSAPCAIGRRGGGESPFTGALNNLHVTQRVLGAGEIASLASSKTLEILAIEKSKRTKTQQDELRKFFREARATDYIPAKQAAEEARKARAAIDAQIPNVMVMSEMDKPRDTFMKVRGAYDKNGDKVVAAFPAFLNTSVKYELPETKPRLTRLDLAQWITSPQHPLTARVAVNRFWAMLFGTGLVRTVNDFGSQGEFPSHPELLDWLAADFARDWDVKRALKQIVMSRTFRQSAAASAELLARDTENRLLARGPRTRLDAEFVRDNALAISGLLNPAIGGKPVRPYQPPGIWSINEVGGGWNQQHDDGQYRRALYIYHRRSTPYPSLLTFDAPSREVCTAGRPRTSTPLQSLVLMNDPVYVEAARAFAARAIKDGGSDDASRLNHAWRLALARTPSPAERGVLERALSAQRAHFAADKAAADALLKVGDFKNPNGIERNELAAWTAVANIILNLNETISR
jgi:hypothetical protein